MGGRITFCALQRTDSGRPWQNGPDETFNGKRCDERADLQWLLSPAETKTFIEDLAQVVQSRSS